MAVPDNLTAELEPSVSVQIDFQTLSCTSQSNQPRDAIQLFVNELFKLERESTLVTLPASLQLLVPREKKLQPKVLTRWEQFAKKKGITKKGRVQKVSVEGTPTGRGYGYTKKGDLEGWIEEVDEEGNTESQLKKQAKQKNLQKNEYQQQRNTKERELLKKGASVSAARASTRQELVGTPRKEQLKRELINTKKSTQSLGRFDKQLDGDVKIKGVKRKYDSNTRDTQADKEVGEEVYQKLYKTDGQLNKRKAVMYAKKN
jgi:regulator of ribosome biosynthesis